MHAGKLPGRGTPHAAGILHPHHVPRRDGGALFAVPRKEPLWSGVELRRDSVKTPAAVGRQVIGGQTSQSPETSPRTKCAGSVWGMATGGRQVPSVQSRGPASRPGPLIHSTSRGSGICATSFSLVQDGSTEVQKISLPVGPLTIVWEISVWIRTR